MAWRDGCDAAAAAAAAAALPLLPLLRCCRRTAAANHWPCFAVCRSVQACCAMTGEGLYEGLDWLSKAIAARAKA